MSSHGGLLLTLRQPIIILSGFVYEAIECFEMRVYNKQLLFFDF